MIVDLDGDSLSDVLIYGKGTVSGFPIVIYYNQGGGKFVRYDVNTSTSVIENLTLSDVDCDGLPDILWNSNSQLNWNANLGRSFSTEKQIPGAAPREIKAMVAGTFGSENESTVALAQRDAAGSGYELLLLLGSPK
jgi:hypothetical protein